MKLKFILIIFTLSLIFYLFFLNRGIIFYDEGYILESTKLVLDGKIPYKDFYFQYTPLTVWLGALWLKLTGLKILNLRLLASILSLLTVFIGLKISQKLKSKLVITLCFLSLLMWGFPQANFLWPNYLNTLFLFVIILLLLNQRVNFLLVGIFTSLLFLTKQNLGMANLASVVGYFAYLKLKRNENIKIFNFLLGFFTPLFISFFLLDTQNNPGIVTFFLRSAEIGYGNKISSLYSIFKNFNLIKMIFYLSPFFAYLLGFILAVKRQIKSFLLVFVFTFPFFSINIYPVFDLAHFTFGVSSFVLYLSFLTIYKNKIVNKLTYVFLSFFLLVGIYKLFFMNSYTFETPYLKQTEKVNIDNQTLIVDKKYLSILSELNNFKNTLKKSDLVFVHPYSPMIYYLLEKSPPSYELYTVKEILNKNDQLKVINDLEEKNIMFVVFQTWQEKENESEIGKYIRNNFKVIKNFQDYEILTRI